MVFVTDRDRPRIDPVPEEQWDDDIRTALRTGGGALRSARIPNAVTTMLHQPRLAGSFLAYNAVLLNSSTMDDRLRELVILRVAWRTGSAYEWLQHARIAHRYAISEAEIGQIAEGNVSNWTSLESAVLEATDQLIDSYVVADETWRQLAEHLDEAQLVEFVFVVGTYECLAMAFNSFGVELDPELLEAGDFPLPPRPD
jgi:4-carboxymuconolactone decarboxylase